MRVEYDAEVDSAYLYVTEIEPGAVSDSVPGEGLAEGVTLDFDAQGRLLGIEVLNASERLAPELLGER